MHKNEQKSAVLTTLIMILIIFGMFFIGLEYMDPPEEYGVAVNFGTTDVGQGPPVMNNESQAVEEEVKPVEPEVEQVSQSPAPAETSEEVTETVVTEDPEAIALAKKKKEEEEALKKAEEERIAQELKEAEEAAKKAELDALMGNLDSPNPSSEGDDTTKGVKGKENGDPNATDYYASGGSDSDGNYRLAGRKVLKKPVYTANCEEGTIFVRIEVDKNGNVTKATPGVKGSTSQAPCLMNPAKRAALETKFNVDPDASQIQIGTIVYQFKTVSSN